MDPAFSSRSTSLPSCLGSIPMLDGSNYPDWLDLLSLTITYLDLDMALDETMPPTPTDQSSDRDRANFEKWHRCDKVCRKIILNSISKGIRGSIDHDKNAKELLEIIKSQYEVTDKALGATLINKLTNMKYDGAKGIREHILLTSNIASKLKDVDMSISDGYLIQFILDSLPPVFGPFKVTYNQGSSRWTLNELIARCDQEERRLKAEGQLLVNVVSQKKGKKGPRNFKTNANIPKVDSKSQKPITKKGKKGSDKCHFCGKKGHFKKDCLKRKSWFEKRGIPFNPEAK